MGLFDDLGNRAGNKSTNLMNIRNNVDQLMFEKDYYSQLIENFDGEEQSKQEIIRSSATSYLIPAVLIILVIVMLLAFILCYK